MNQLEEGLPLPLIVSVFVVVFILSTLLQRYLRKRSRIRQGQSPAAGGDPVPIETRLAANRAWASGKIYALRRGITVILWTATIVWFLTFGVSFLKILGNVDAQLSQKVVMGVFSLGGFVFLYFAVCQTLINYRYGRSWCVIKGKAGILGDDFSGEVFTSKPVEATGDYTYTLQCIDTYYTGTGKNRRTNTNVEFQAEQKVPYAGQRSTAGIPFKFNLPKYPPETGYQLAKGSVSWQLKVTAPVQGVDYRAMFIIPVFKM